MFFSVIIPTYNSRATIGRALDSFLENDCLDDIEIIIADDVSTEPFDDIVETYKDRLNIRKIVNEIHYGAPYGGREFGAQAAQGEWLCFMDHDDEWLPHAFDEVKNIILADDIHNYLITDFYTYNDHTGEWIVVSENRNWTHGKFYEHKFWIEQNIHYADTRSCEDINLSVQMACLMDRLNLETHLTPGLFTYIWHQNINSLSQASGIGEYFFKSFPDYIDGTLKVYLDDYLKTDESHMDFYKINTLSMICFLYYYYQGMKYKPNDCPKIPKLYYKKIYENFKRMKKYFHWTTKSFLQDVQTVYLNELDNARNTAKNQIPFFETETFNHFVRMLPIRSII